MAGKEYCFVMVLHYFTEASGNRLSLVPSTSVLFHSDPIAQFCSHPEKYIIFRPGTGALFVIVVLHNSSEVSENRLPLAPKTSAIFHSKTSKKRPSIDYIGPRRLVHYSTATLWHNSLGFVRVN